MRTHAGRGRVRGMLPRAEFNRHMLRLIAVAAALILAWLAIGILGYRYIVGDRDFYQALVDAAMIAGGMGPITTAFPGHAAQVFVSIYALLSGVVVIAGAGIVLGPIVHRILLKMHADIDDAGDDPPAAGGPHRG